MVLARVANFFTNGDATNSLAHDSQSNVAASMHSMESAVDLDTVGGAIEDEIDHEAARPPYLHVRWMPC